MPRSAAPGQADGGAFPPAQHDVCWCTGLLLPAVGVADGLEVTQPGVRCGEHPGVVAPALSSAQPLCQLCKCSHLGKQMCSSMLSAWGREGGLAANEREVSWMRSNSAAVRKAW